MVEGPCCKLKGEKIKSRLLKQRVKDVKGDEVKCSGSETQFQRIVGQSLDEVLTLGKELFMFFGDACLRIHFLMSGTFIINDQHYGISERRNQPTKPILEINLSKDTIKFYNSSAEMRPSSACRQKHHILQDLDVCSSTFNHKRAVAEIMLETERQLCDVLLDQDILPGVGNIIKNEALFDSGMKPDAKVNELSEESLLHLVKMTRDYSLLFYKCRKNGTNLRLHMRVYGKDKCGECGNKITVTRMGEDSARLTYFCATCQTNQIKAVKYLKLPSKNSLLRWMQVNEGDKQDWSCNACTIVNPSSFSNCSMCLTSKISRAVPGVCSSLTPTNLALPRSSFSTPSSARKRRALTDMTVSPVSVKKRPRMQGDFLSHIPLITSETGINCSPVLENKMQGLSSNFTASPNINENAADSSKIPFCRCLSKKKCLIKQTFKENANKGRWFFTCASASASKRCNYFQWADEGFPVCPGHCKPCALCTVMKQGPNNGRNFFCCSLKKNGCKFFEWAVGYNSI